MSLLLRSLEAHCYLTSKEITMKKLFIILILAISLVGLFSVFKINRNTTPSVSQKTEKNTIHIMNYAFTPKTMTVKKGTTITWKNYDIAKHTITKDNDSKEGPQSEFFGQGETYSFQFTKVGTYTYHCEPHPYMKGEITVIE
ncbi:hypothetical protein BH11PAT1_BH11PAT1_7940 [soil metagenome]